MVMVMIMVFGYGYGDGYGYGYGYGYDDGEEERNDAAHDAPLTPTQCQRKWRTSFGSAS